MDKQTFKEFSIEKHLHCNSGRRLNKRAFLRSIISFIIAWGMGFQGLIQRFFISNSNQSQKIGTTSDSHLFLKGFSQPANAFATNSYKKQLGVETDGRSRVFLAQGRSPEKNMISIIDSIGGIEKIIGPHDIVIVKPNSQWWAQGMTNTDAIKAFMESVLSVRGFDGEIIIADNHQYSNPNSRGWTTEDCNGKFNYNELVAHFQNLGYANVTKYHWRGAGPNPTPLEGDDQLGSKIVEGPGDEDGYVWSSDIVYVSPMGRRCLLTWPVFTSKYSGITIDFKNGAWIDGAYIDRPIKFINFSAVNHHGPYAGVTASVKNYMGIVDMTCGFHGSTPKGYYNTHFIGLRNLKIPFQKKFPWRIQNWIYHYNWRYFEHTGGVLGTFMREVRIADINFITAHWVGWGSRTKAERSGKPRALLASRDPVALDYVAGKEVLMPLTENNTTRRFFLRMNDVDIDDGPYKRFLKACNSEGIGNLNPKMINVERVSK